MRKVVLYGELANRFGKEHFFAVRSAAEALQALSANFGGFREYMNNAHKLGVGFKVKVGKVGLSREQEAALPSSDTDTIRIAPAIFGSGGVLKVLVGAALILTGVGAFGIGTIISSTVSGVITKVGVAMALNGLYELLAPTPKVPGGGTFEDSQSYIFSGPENTTRQGEAVAVGYGRMMIGSTVISAGIEDSDQ